MVSPQDSYEEFLSRLDPTTAKRVRTAAGVKPKRIPLASDGLTRLLGGGIPSGRVTTIYGNYSAGKSLLAMESAGRFWQPAGLRCAYVDVERSFDEDWARKLGIDPDILFYEEAKGSDKVEAALRPLLKANIDVVIIDSISDIMPAAFYDDKGELNVADKRKQTGAHAKALTNLYNGIHALNENTAVVLISQTTTSIQQTYVEQIPHGGKKTEFGSSVMIKLTSSNSEGQVLKDKVQRGDRLIEKPIGRKVDALLKKSKQGNQFSKCEYNVYYEGPHIGIDRVQETVEYAIEVGALTGTTWLNLNYDGPKLQWQGKKNAADAFRADPKLLDQVKKIIHLKETGEILE